MQFVHRCRFMRLQPGLQPRLQQFEFASRQCKPVVACAGGRFWQVIKGLHLQVLNVESFHGAQVKCWGTGAVAVTVTGNDDAAVM